MSHDPTQPLDPTAVADALSAALGFIDQPTLAALAEAVDQLDGPGALAVLQSTLELAGVDVAAEIEAAELSGVINGEAP